MFKKVLLTLVLSLFSFGSISAQVVNVGGMGTGAEGAFFMGLEKGYFKDLGLEIGYRCFDPGAKAMWPGNSWWVI